MLEEEKLELIVSPPSPPLWAGVDLSVAHMVAIVFRLCCVCSGGITWPLSCLEYSIFHLVQSRAEMTHYAYICCRSSVWRKNEQTSKECTLPRHTGDVAQIRSFEFPSPWLLWHSRCSRKVSTLCCASSSGHCWRIT